MSSPQNTSNPGPILRVENLRLQYPVRRGALQRVQGYVSAVDGVSFAINRGETLGLVGESGCGKSSLGRAILRLQEPSAGQVWLQDVDISSAGAGGLRRLRRSAQLIFQDPYASVNPRMRVADIVGEPLRIHGVRSERERSERVKEALEVVGIRPAVRGRYPHEFSGGQLQRIGIARALILRPQLLVLDEPVSALDVSIQAQILNLLDELQAQYRLTYLFIAHDLGVVRHVSTQVAVMYLGQFVELAHRNDLYQSPLHPYTRALLSAVPVPDPVRERTRKRIILTGDLPDPTAPPNGCRFHTRCWLREDLGRPKQCEVEAPELRSVEGRQVRCHFAEESLGRAKAGGSAPSATQPQA